MSILIVYASTEGQTKKIATELAQTLVAQDNNCDLVNVEDAINFAIDSYDAFIIAASVHHAEHQRSIFHFVTDHLELLNRKDSCFLSVSLNAALPDDLHQKEADNYVKQFLNKTDWKPKAYLCVAGALRYQEMDYFRRELARTILRHTMGSTDVDLSCDYEYTDFEALYEFVEDFIQSRRRYK